MTPFELSIFYFINHDLAHPWLDPLMNGISSSMLWAIVGFGITLGAFRFYYQRGALRSFFKIAMLFALSLSLTDIFNAYVLKETVARKRPCHELTDVRLAAPRCGGLNGLPSNHAANGMAGLTMWYLLFGRKAGRRMLGVMLLMLLLAVGFSRIYLGVHYPSDIFAGFGVGAMVASLVYRLGRIGLAG